MFDALRHRIAFKQGRKLLIREHWQPAASLLGLAVKLDPNHWESHNNLACALLKLGRFEEAAGMVQRAISLSPNAPDSHAFFGIALLHLERWEEAIAAYRRAIAITPSVESYERLGMAFSRLGRWADMADAYRHAVELKPDDHALLERLGSILCVLKRWDEAATALRHARDLRSGGEDPFRHLPAEHAAPVYWRMLSLNSENMQSAVELANDLAALDGTPETIAAHRRAVELAPGDAAAYLGLGIELAKLKQWDEAERTLQKGASLTTSDSSFQFLRVDPLMRLGRYEEAVQVHARAVERLGSLPALPGEPAAIRFDRGRATFWTRENLVDDTFAIERWLGGLMQPVGAESAPPDPRAPRLLFVLDNDYGELTTLMYLLMGQPLARLSTLLLPDRLFAHNADTIPGRTHRFGSLEDVLDVVERLSPDIVFLCSGYLMSPHLILSAEELDRLVELLRQRGCRVVTTDPFLGILSKYDPRTSIRIEVPPTHPLYNLEQLTRAKQADEEKLWTYFSKSERTLKKTFHLYPAYCGGADPETDRTDARNLSFFNERLLLPASSAVPAPTPSNGATVPQPHWLFVLSHADFDTQLLHDYENKFTDVVARKLVETAAAGRHPILIAPEQLVRQLVPRMPTTEGIDILSFCGFRQFTSLLLSAEVAFYWNLVSHSILIRLFNGLPVVLFDRGHLVRNVSAIETRVIRWYYQGAQPLYRDARQRLTLETVEAWTADQRRDGRGHAERFRRAPTPDQLVAELMNGEPAPSI